MVKKTIPRKEWQQLLRFLRKKFPTSVPMHIRRVKRINSSGITIFDGYKFNIYISLNQDYEGQLDAIRHEVAHALAIDEAYQHKGRWGTLYGEIYEAWEKWDAE